MSKASHAHPDKQLFVILSSHNGGQQMKKAKAVSTKKAKSSDKPPASWETAILDAQLEINRLQRSIELFKHNQRVGIPFPVATQN
jgi:hypothetical protein